VNEGGVKIVTGEPTPLQLSAWRKLWSRLLAPSEAKNPVAADETSTGAEGVPAASGATETTRDYRARRISRMEVNDQ
jgi:hypothetical protein